MEPESTSTVSHSLAFFRCSPGHSLSWKVSRPCFIVEGRPLLPAPRSRPRPWRCRRRTQQAQLRRACQCRQAQQRAAFRLQSQPLTPPRLWPPKARTRVPCEARLGRACDTTTHWRGSAQPAQMRTEVAAREKHNALDAAERHWQEECFRLRPPAPDAIDESYFLVVAPARRIFNNGSSS